MVVGRKEGWVVASSDFVWWHQPVCGKGGAARWQVTELHLELTLADQ